MMEESNVMEMSILNHKGSFRKNRNMDLIRCMIKNSLQESIWKVS
jgi:hypothetical protein